MAVNTPRDRRHTLLLALVVAMLVLATLGTAAVMQAAGTDSDDVREYGLNHQLATTSAIESYEETGVASTPLSGLDASVTIAASHDAVGLSGLEYTDVDTHWLRLQYNESITRTVSFVVPSEYWHPHPVEERAAAESDLSVDLQPVGNNTGTRVTVTFTGQTDAVIPISREAAVVFEVRDKARGRIENVTGIDLPELSSSGDWQRLPSDALTGNTTTATIARNGAKTVLVQYNAAGNDSEARWLSMPACSASESAPVCRFSNGDTNTVRVLSRTQDAPAVRYRRGGGLLAQAEAAVNELLEVPDRILSDFPSLDSLSPW
jgi:hypothetical protein